MDVVLISRGLQRRTAIFFPTRWSPVMQRVIHRRPSTTTLARRSAAILCICPVLTMGPSRRPDQARRQHRKQLRHIGYFSAQTLYVLKQAITPDVIEDSTNQLVGTGLTYVVDADEQTSSVQPPTTSQPWCACSKNGISQSRCCDTCSVCLSSIFCKHAEFLLHLVHTYLLVPK